MPRVERTTTYSGNLTPRRLVENELDAPSPEWKVIAWALPNCKDLRIT